MSTTRSTNPIRRASIVVPFVVAYGLGLYLVVGAVGDAFSGQSGQRDPDAVAGRPIDRPADATATIAPAALAEAVAALERTDAVQKLVRGQQLSVVRAGPWTAGEPGTTGPSPSTGKGIALTIDLPQPIDVDLSTLPGAEAAASTPPVAGGGGPTLPDVGSLLVLYDPATDEVAAVHPVPKSAPPPPQNLGAAPDVAPGNDPDEAGAGAVQAERTRG